MAVTADGNRASLDEDDVGKDDRISTTPDADGYYYINLMKNQTWDEKFAGSDTYYSILNRFYRPKGWTSPTGDDYAPPDDIAAIGTIPTAKVLRFRT